MRPNSDLILWTELAPRVGCDGDRPQFVLAELADLITAMVRDQFEQHVSVRTIAEALQLPTPELVKWDDLFLYLQDLGRQAAQARIGQVPTSPVAALTALSAGELVSAGDLSQQPGISRRNLALAIGLPENVTKEEILAEVERLHNLADPLHRQEKEIKDRLALVGFSADAPATDRRDASPDLKALREKLVLALCADIKSLRFFEGRKHYWNVQYYVQNLSDAQIISLTVASLAASVRGNPGARIVPLRASAGAKPGALPVEMTVLDWGTNRTLKGNIVVNEKTVAAFDATQRRIGRERVVLDYEHSTVPGTDSYTESQEPREVAAYWTPEVICGRGIVLHSPTWTPSGERNALNYEDISAAPIMEGDTVIGLHSVALTRAGASDFTFLDVPQIPGALVSTSAPRTIR